MQSISPVTKAVSVSATAGTTAAKETRQMEHQGTPATEGTTEAVETPLTKGKLTTVGMPATAGTLTTAGMPSNITSTRNVGLGNTRSKRNLNSI